MLNATLKAGNSAQCMERRHFCLFQILRQFCEPCNTCHKLTSACTLCTFHPSGSMEIHHSSVCCNNQSQRCTHNYCSVQCHACTGAGLSSCSENAVQYLRHRVERGLEWCVPNIVLIRPGDKAYSKYTGTCISMEFDTSELQCVLDPKHESWQRRVSIHCCRIIHSAS